MNAYLQMIILGIVQGVAEFLPISSSGHLVIVEQLMFHFTGQEIAEGKEAEVMLHLGTLVAIGIVYAKELLAAFRNPRLVLMLAAATVPAGLAGLLLEDWFDQAFDAPVLSGFGLLMTAALLLTAHRFERADYSDTNLPWTSGILIGCFQAVALVPGISRSGSTISGGLLTGVERTAATRFSFLLAVPITLAAIGLTSVRILRDGGMKVPLGPLLVGMIVSFVVGLASLRWLIRMVNQRRLHWFAIYCACVGGLSIAFFSHQETPRATEPAPEISLGEEAPNGADGSVLPNVDR